MVTPKEGRGGREALGRTEKMRLLRHSDTQDGRRGPEGAGERMQMEMDRAMARWPHDRRRAMAQTGMDRWTSIGGAR